VRIFLDTNVLVAAIVSGHVHHERAFPIFERVAKNKDEGFVSVHTIAEVYSALTRLPPPFRHSPTQALLSIEENILKHFKPVTLTATEYATMVREAAAAGIQGGTIHDAVLMKCAAKSEANRMYTFNLKHFLSIASGEFRSRISSP